MEVLWDPASQPVLGSHTATRPQLWEVSSGELLLSVLFDVGVLAVTMDLAEHYMFCGGSDGSIFQVDLCTWVSVAKHWTQSSKSICKLIN